MKTLNQELFELNMPQHIIEDEEYKNIPIGLTGQKMADELNRVTLESMYRVQEAVYRLFGQCDMREIEANTINPAQQNIFVALKTWNINLIGCYAIVRIHQRGLGGCFANIEIL